MQVRPLRFIGEPIEVQFDEAPAFEKRPHCPNRFLWRGELFEIVEMLSEWHDYARKGRMALNMSPAHLAAAGRRGSWGVGRFTFRVRVDSGRVFDLYYDRAPDSAGDRHAASGSRRGRKGSWFLYREMSSSEDAQ